MADGQLPHIVLRNISRPERFSTPRGGGKNRYPSPVPDREAHAQRLLQQLRDSEEAAREAVGRRTSLLPPPQNGVFLTVEGRPTEPLLTDRLERRSKNIELLAVKEEVDRTTATLFVPETAKNFFTKAIEDYRTKSRAKTLEPRGRNLIEGIGNIRLTALSDLWFDAPETFPAPTDTIDWEVWIRPSASDHFRVAAMESGVIFGTHPLVFPEDVALFVRTTPEVLARLNESTLAISRLARSKRIAGSLISAPPGDQARVMDEFLARVRFANPASTWVCILDTGVNREHRLLAPLLAPQDCLSFHHSWQPHDEDGHGTKMAGICAYGDLARAMIGAQSVEVPYCIESVKIFPPFGQNPHELLGAITAGGVARAELANPNRKRLFCLATTTDEDTPHNGRPTSWSAELDQLSFGSEITPGDRRLFCVSAGNIREPQQLRHADYPGFNDLQEIESPAHAWNALTVGAFTELTEITDPTRAGWVPFANSGDLCPVSRTARWTKEWPIKPDVVAEGGNLGVDPADGLGYGFPEVKLLTTSKDFPQIPFETFGDTSAATADASRLCAIVQSQYPHLWPETVRALVVESAEWTDAMLSYLPTQNPKKEDYGLLLKRYGFGVPNLERALYSARNALTLIAEDAIRPYVMNTRNNVILNEMKLFLLPWPREALTLLENTEVSMRVTLSYFIEPNPAEIARNRKSGYASHGLRFAVKLPDEEPDVFRRRVNKAAREMGNPGRYESDSSWMLGPNLRDRGSLHSDTWRGPASDLARRGMIAVYPVSGWWKERKHLERYNRSARFSLVVSITTPTTEVDIYTPVTNQITIRT